ncbi:putative transmembrane protein [Mycobacterium xenopi 3993]|nr:putative transmembrane protein [Mycobacterium xenopi 3993]
MTGKWSAPPGRRRHGPAAGGHRRSDGVDLGRRHHPPAGRALMRYPDNVLADGEQVVLHRHPHWKRLVGAVTVLILASGLASFVAGFVNTRPWDPNAKNVIFGSSGRSGWCWSAGSRYGRSWLG